VCFKLYIQVSSPRTPLSYRIEYRIAVIKVSAHLPAQVQGRNLAYAILIHLAELGPKVEIHIAAQPTGEA